MNISIVESSYMMRDSVAVLYPELSHWSVQDHLLTAYDRTDMLRAERGVDTTYFNVLTEDEQVIGTGGLRMYETDAELTCLAVLPSHRSQGIGKQLIDVRLQRAALLGACSVFVETLEKTNTLASYYSQLGFAACAAGEANPVFARGSRRICGPGLIRRTSA